MVPISKNLKRITILLTFILSAITVGCGETKEEGRLYTRDDIFIDCIKISYPDGFTSKLIIIEDDEALKSAVIEFPKLKSMPGFEEIQKNYPIDEHVYAVQFIETDFESETITCDGVVVDKENGTIRFKINSQKKKHDTFESLAGYIAYAVFPKEELAGCDFSKQPYVHYPAAGLEEPGTEVFEEYLTFEELILKSDVAIIGSYVETIRHDRYIEHKFLVRECLYGDVAENEIYLYSDIGTGYIEETGYTYRPDGDIYKVGSDYILVMEKLQSVMYDHDRFMLSADVVLNESDKEYTMYSQPISVPSGVSVKDYICSVYANAKQPNVERDAVAYEDEIAEMVGESEFIGTVKILELVNEGKVHNGNVYRCLVEKLMKGSNLNTYDDGAVLIIIKKDLVDIDGIYIIGFSPVESGSLIYMQATAGSVHAANNELEHRVSELSESME